MSLRRRYHHADVSDGPRTVDFRLWTSGFGYWTLDLGLWNVTEGFARLVLVSALTANAPPIPDTHPSTGLSAC